MPIASFGFVNNPSSIYARHGDVWIIDDITPFTDWKTLGSIETLTINGEAVAQGEDTHKRQYQIAVMITVEFTMKQNDYTGEIGNLDSLAVPATDGHHMKFTDCGVEGATQLDINTNVPLAAGCEFTGVQPQVGLQLDFGGGTSLIPVSFTGQIALSEFIKIGSEAVSLTTC